MTERKKKILSLLVSSSILFGLTGCSKNTNNLENAKNLSITQMSEIDLNDLDRYYIVEITNINNESVIYLTMRCPIIERYSPSRSEFKIFNKDVTIVSYSVVMGYTSEYGNVINVVPFKQFISTYAELKDTYTEEEMTNVFNCIKKDYNQVIKNANVKKLELK